VLNAPWLYSCVKRVPDISAEQIAAMRYIEPVVPVSKGSRWYRCIANGQTLDPHNVAFNWDVRTIGEPFVFGEDGEATIITQHKCAYFFKPSLAEVYAAILHQLPDAWQRVRYFCLDEVQQIPGTTDYYALCHLFSGPRLVVENGGSNGRLVLMAEDCAVPST
jgi:hypothetical protein